LERELRIAQRTPPFRQVAKEEHILGPAVLRLHLIYPLSASGHRVQIRMSACLSGMKPAMKALEFGGLKDLAFRKSDFTTLLKERCSDGGVMSPGLVHVLFAQIGERFLKVQDGRVAFENHSPHQPEWCPHGFHRELDFDPFCPILYHANIPWKQGYLAMLAQFRPLVSGSGTRVRQHFLPAPG
jgi:hypothetical protein